MEIGFKSEKDKCHYQSFDSLSAAHGVIMAKKIGQRLAELQAAENAGCLPRGARFHAHKGDRKGLFSIDLVHPFRLIVTPKSHYSVWSEIDNVEIYQIIDPH